MKGSALLSAMIALALLGSLTAFLIGYTSHSLKLAQNYTHTERARNRAYQAQLDLEDWHSPVIGKSGRFSFQPEVQIISAHQAADLLYLTSIFGGAVPCQTANSLEILKSLSPSSLRAQKSCLEFEQAEPIVSGNLTVGSESVSLNGPALSVAGAVIVHGELLLNQSTLIFALGDIVLDSIANVADELVTVSLVSLTGRVMIHSIPSDIQLDIYQGGVQGSSGEHLFEHELIKPLKRELLILGLK